MITPKPARRNSNSAPAGDLFQFALFSVVVLVWIALRLSGIPLDVRLEVVFSGLAIVAGSFLLTWAAEAAERDVPQAFALGILALIIVIPEYAVAMYFTWTASARPEYLQFPTASMTGANRILIGWGWALIAFLYMIRSRKPSLVLESPRRTELAFLVAATLYSFLIPLKGTLSLADGVVFLLLFALYGRCLAKSDHEESELIGPALTLAEMPGATRRFLVTTFMVLAGVGIFLSAKPFSEGLLGVGRAYGWDEYLLIQWIAPLASEAPELIIATLLTLKSKPSAAFGTLISSKVNQWTLLVGMLPIVYIVSSVVHGLVSIRESWSTVLPLDNDRRVEMFLTSAQSLFACIILSDFAIAWWEAMLLFALFTYQMLVPNEAVRLACAWVYMALAVGYFMASRKQRQGLKQAAIQFLACSGVSLRRSHKP